MKRLLYLIFFVALNFTFFSCNSPQNSSKQTVEAIAINTEEVSLNETERVIQLSGNIEGNKTVKLGFMLSGKIKSFPWKEGEFISSGQLVASLDTELYQLALDGASTQVEQLEAENKRLKYMHDRQSISDADYDKIVYGLRLAKTQQKKAQIDIKNTQLQAPFSGIILKKLNEEGEIVAQGYPVVAISDISKVNVLTYVPDRDLKFLKIGQKAKVRIAALDQEVEGIVKEVGGLSEPTTRTFTVKIQVENSSKLIRPGMIAEISIHTTEKRKAVTVSAQAILNDVDGSKYVYVFESSKDKAYKRKVIVGSFMETNVEILEGLGEGEQVVIAGQHRLADGESVQLKK